MTTSFAERITMAKRPHDRTARRELLFATLAIVVAVASVSFVSERARQAAATLDRRRALLAEFEQLRNSVELALDLDGEAQRRQLEWVRSRVTALQPAWRRTPPVAGSLPVLAHRQDREVLVLERDDSLSLAEPVTAEAAPR